MEYWSTGVMVYRNTPSLLYPDTSFLISSAFAFAPDGDNCFAACGDCDLLQVTPDSVTGIVNCHVRSGNRDVFVEDAASCLHKGVRRLFAVVPVFLLLIRLRVGRRIRRTCARRWNTPLTKRGLPR
jgi:hypothetical protein